MRGKPWTREELILTFNLYLKIPFGKISSRNSEVQALARLLGRTDNSIALRLTNFAACDPYLVQRGIKGMVGGLNQVIPIWNEFADNRDALLFESERILAEMQYGSLEKKYPYIYKDLSNLQGESKIREVKTRVNQNVFRKIVLTNYNHQCALSGIDVEELLIASHIMPWSVNKEERLNPANGICLSALYDKAFDQGLISFDMKYNLVLSKRLKKNVGKEYYNKYFGNIEGQQLRMPNKFLPEKRFLEWHLDCVFEK